MTTGISKVGDEFHPTFSYRFSPSSVGITLKIESSSDLRSWGDVTGGFEEILSVVNDDGTINKTLRSSSPIGDESGRYYRLKVELN